MRSRLAEELRTEQQRSGARSTPGQRVRLALALGARDLALFASARGLTRAEARRELERLGQIGRRQTVGEEPG